MLNELIGFIYFNEAGIRLSVFLGGFSLLAIWEWNKPKRELIHVKSKRWLNNLALVVCSTIVVRILIPTAAIGAAYVAEQNQWGISNTIDLPFWLKVVISFVLLDLVIYFQHAIFHVLPIFWRFHRVHHTDLDFDITTGLRFHPAEILISMLFKIIVIFALGAPVLAVILFEVVLNFMSMFSHSNIYLNKKFEKILRWFIVTPDMHRVHHSTIENETNSNFAFNISLWDRLFGTYIAEPHAGYQDMSIGLEGHRDPDKLDFKDLLVMPFKKAIRGYAINYRDTLNADELSRVNKLVAQQTESLKQAKEITEQKNSQLKKTVSNLIDSSHYQSMLIENMFEGFISIDQYGTIDSFNPAAEKLFGYKAEEMIGENVSKLMVESEASHHDRHLAHYKEKNEHHVIGVSRDLEGQRKDGSLFPIDIALSDVNIRGKQIFTAIIRDISKRKEAEEKLLAAKKYAEETSQAKTNFIASMTHELHTPLNAIIGFSQLLKIDPNLDSKQMEQVRDIQNAGNHLLRLVEDVLNYSKLTGNDIELHLNDISLEELLVECVSMVSSFSSESSVSVNVEQACNQYKVKCDPVRFKQIVINILSNAIKYNCDNGKVIISCKQCDNNMLRLIFTDTGLGIDSCKLDELFEPFNRLGQEGSTIQGLGVGLSISKQLIELMDGNIGVDSTVGKGSRFWIEIPLTDRV